MGRPASRGPPRSLLRQTGNGFHDDDEPSRRRPSRRSRPPTTRQARAASLGRYILVRFLLIFPTIFILVTMVFFLMRTDRRPDHRGARRPSRRADQLAERIDEAGYDRPIIVQYLEYLGQVFTGNFGTTLTDNQPVVDVLVTLRRRHPRARASTP